MYFHDREEAARRLAEALSAYSGKDDVIVLALPRGAVHIGEIVAERLGAPLDVVLVRKIGAPGNPEYAAGAIALDGEIVSNPEAGVDRSYLDAEGEVVLAELRRRDEAYHVDSPRLDVKGKTAIVVDDGIATGLTATAAARYLHRQGASRVVLAVPVIAAASVADMKREVDDLVVLDAPSGFYAVGQFYEEFPQLDDEEVVRTLSRRSAML